jgi:hypothetical protein
VCPVRGCALPRCAPTPALVSSCWIIARRPTPPDTSPDDLWAMVIVLRGTGFTPQGETLRDPDGHLIRLEAGAAHAAR